MTEIKKRGNAEVVGWIKYHEDLDVDSTFHIVESGVGEPRQEERQRNHQEQGGAEVY